MEKVCQLILDFLQVAFNLASGGYLRNENVNLATRFSYCDFSQTDDKGKSWDRCRLYGDERFAYNLYQCKDRHNKTLICANNCRGVDPNSILAGGLALIFTSPFVNLGTLIPFIAPALGLLAAGGAGGAAVAGGGSGSCPPRTCRVKF